MRLEKRVGGEESKNVGIGRGQDNKPGDVGRKGGEPREPRLLSTQRGCEY